MIEVGSAQGVYFDGASSPALWEGTADASASDFRTYGLTTQTGYVAALAQGTAVGVEYRQQNVQHDGPLYSIHKRLSRNFYWTALLGAEKGLPGGGNLVNRFTQQEITMPMLSKPGFAGDDPPDPSITLAGTWTGVSASTRQYNGGHRRSNTAASTATFVCPVGATRIALRCPIGPAGGFAKVKIDGDCARAALLPMAADLYARGVMTSGQRDALGATSRIIDFYSYAHGSSRGLQDRMNLMLAIDLDPTAVHTVVVEVTGEKASWASDTLVYESGFSYDQPGIAPYQTGVELLRYKGIFTNSHSAQEYATSAATVDGSFITTIGSVHGYETQQSIVPYVDGQPVTLVQDGGVTWGSKVTLVRQTTLQHPAYVGDVASVETAYTMGPDSFEVSWKRSWLQNILLKFDYLMFVVDGWRLNKARASAEPADRSYPTHSTAGDPTDNVGTAAKVELWEPGGDLWAAMSVPDIRKGLSSWSFFGSLTRIQNRTSINGNSSIKVYMDRIHTGGATDLVAAPRTDRATMVYEAEVRPGVDTRAALT